MRERLLLELRPGSAMARENRAWSGRGKMEESGEQCAAMRCDRELAVVPSSRVEGKRVSGGVKGGVEVRPVARWRAEGRREIEGRWAGSGGKVSGRGAL